MQIRKKVVAVVENNPSMLKAIERLLLGHGFVVKPYASAEAFLEHATPNELNCLVLDIHLGDMSGIQLRRRLAAAGCTIPVIFMTASDCPATHREAVETGCLACLPKPFSGSSLLHAIDQSS